MASALLQAFLIQAFVNPANLLPSGFTGIAVLIDRITALFGVRISTDLGMLALNIPLASSAGTASPSASSSSL